MEAFRDSNLFLKCRLCGVFGHHKHDILDENQSIACSNSNALNEKIFSCVGVWVIHSDFSPRKYNMV